MSAQIRAASSKHHISLPAGCHQQRRNCLRSRPNLYHTIGWNSVFHYQPHVYNTDPDTGFGTSRWVSPITVTATLRDLNDNLIPGRTIVFASYGQAVVKIAKPTITTGANGQATTTITATTPGTSTICLCDPANGNFIVSATVLFTQQGFVLPNSDLLNAIVILYQNSGGALSSIASIAKDAGAYGDKSWNAILGDKAQVYWIRPLPLQMLFPLYQIHNRVAACWPIRALLRSGQGGLVLINYPIYSMQVCFKTFRPTAFWKAYWYWYLRMRTAIPRRQHRKLRDLDTQ